MCTHSRIPRVEYPEEVFTHQNEGRGRAHSILGSFRGLCLETRGESPAADHSSNEDGLKSALWWGCIYNLVESELWSFYVCYSESNASDIFPWKLQQIKRVE